MPPFFSAQNPKHVRRLISCFSQEWSSGSSQRGLLSLKNVLKTNKKKKKSNTRPDVWFDVSRGTWKYTNRKWERWKVGKGGTPRRSPPRWPTFLWCRPERVEQQTSVHGHSIPELLVSRWDQLQLKERGEGWRWRCCCAGALSQFHGLLSRENPEGETVSPPVVLSELVNV